MARRRRLVLLVWALLVLAAVPFSLHQTDRLTSGGGISPGSQSQRVDSALRRFPRSQLGQQGILIHARGQISAAKLASKARRARRQAATVTGVTPTPLEPRQARELARKGLAFVPVTLKGGQDERVDTAVDLREKLDIGTGAKGRTTTYLVGQDSLWAALHELQKKQLAAAETVGFPITLLILLATFGALAAAALPMSLAVVSVTLTGAAIYFLSRVTPMSSFVTNAASMIGIGVAIDYSLFILARYRQEIATGADRDTARARALATSGSAVVFSGFTVIVSLAGVLLVDSKLLRSMALGMIVIVTISILGAVTLLPALMDLLGHRVERPGKIGALVGRLRGGRGTARDYAEPGAFWTRWTERVMRWPVLSVIAASALMLALAVPALSIHLNQTAVAEFPKDDEARKGTEVAAQAFGPGRLGPAYELVRFDRGKARSKRNSRALRKHLRYLRALPQVAAVDPPEVGRDGRQVLISVVPRSSPESEAARKLLRELRARSAGGGGLARVASVDVGGNTALPQDFASLIKHNMWKIALFVIALCYVVLLVMLRSLVLPLKAVLMTGLSVVASYGVLVAVFQWGWLDGLLGYDSPGFVEAPAPPLLLAMVFGLSMDYEVFMLSRIREHVRPGVEPRTAVAKGLIASAGTITSAALIMVSVFGAFGAVGQPTVKQVGIGLAVAVALDATIVRLVLVPATMELLGKLNWWLPSGLARVLPKLPDEGVVPAPSGGGGRPPPPE